MSYSYSYGGSQCNCLRIINNDDPCILRCKSHNKYPPVLRLQPPPPPPPSPPPPPVILPSQNHDQKSLLVTGMTVIASTLTSVLALCIFFAIVRFYFNKRINHSRRRSLPVAFFGSRDDFWINEDRTILNLDNPVWYINTVGLQQSVIDSITVFNYKKDDGLIEGTECSVCLNEFEEDESLRLLPKCSHGFHIPCIDTWLRSHQNCPFCRAPVVCGTMVARTSDETGVENDVGEGGTSEDIRDEDTSGGTSEDIKDGEIQATRRSVSLEFCSAIEIASEVSAEQKHGGSLDSEFEEMKYLKGKNDGKRSSSGKLMKSTSIGRSLSKGPVSMKRSFSSCGISCS